MANLNFNKVMLGGRLTADPELKTTTSGVMVTTFSLAVNRRYSKDAEKQQTDFINVTAWRQTAEFITKHFHKGSNLFVVGSLQVRSWEDQEGKKRYATEVIADEAYFVDSKAEAGQGTNAEGTYVPSAYTATAPKFEDLGDGEDLPF